MTDVIVDMVGEGRCGLSVLVVRSRTGVETFRLTGTERVIIDGAGTGIDRVQIGMTVVVHVNAQGVVSLIEARSGASTGGGSGSVERPSTPRTVDGTISEVVPDRGYMFVRTATGTEQVSVPRDARIVLNGALASLERLTAGMTVFVEFGADGSVTVVNARG